MSLKAAAAKWLAQRRVAQVARWKQPAQMQEQTLLRNLRRAASTQFGKHHHFSGIRSVRDFQASVPLRTYEELVLYIDRAYAGEPDVLWPGRPLYFANTSGTTAGKKHIPLTRELMQKQVQGAKDALLFYIHETGDASFLDGKMMFLSGSPALAPNPAGIPEGRLSGISQHFVPKYLQGNRKPSFATNCIEDWEAKLDAILDETLGADLRLISGIPPWVQMLCERLEARTGKKAAEVWPNLRLFAHGGVDYRPYYDIFTQAFGEQIALVETYPASEGFVAVQNQRADDGLLLLLDFGIFYEFIPLEHATQPNPPRLTLAEVELGKHYALAMSTNAGLWAYMIGDVVKFTSLAPYKIRVTGRVKHFISAFGEHVIEEEVNGALAQACRETGLAVVECTVAPRISQVPGHSCHEWYIEFAAPPASLEAFAQVLDSCLVAQNPYYADLRNGAILAPCRVLALKPGAPRAYMKSEGKLGGQNKFPRLLNDRRIADFFTGGGWVALPEAS